MAQGFATRLENTAGKNGNLLGASKKQNRIAVSIRIIHQQGRAQLNSVAGFGTPEAPNCRGLTPEEFQSIDFSKIDFSEYYGDLVPDTMTQIEGKISNGVTDFYNSNQ